MFKLPFELLLGYRYTRAKRRNGFISFISLSSILGIALGVTALITIMSIMNGFQTELRDRILGMTAHMTLSEERDRLGDWQALYNKVRHLPRVEGAAPNIMEKGMLTKGDRVRGVLIRGVLPEYEVEVTDIKSKMILGSLDDLESSNFNIILGAELALSLGVTLGDQVTLLAPQGSISPMGIIPRIKRFTVSGVFRAGMFEYDSGLALIHIGDAQRVFKYRDKVSGLQLELTDMFDLVDVRQSIAEVTESTLFVRDWTQQHSNFFKAIEMEKRMMFIVLTLIIMVAAFNIVSTMIMVVTDKKKDIAVLRTIGASPLSIQIMFIIQGLIIGISGSLLGLAGGITLSLNIDVIVPFIESMLGITFFPPDVYYISVVPSELVWRDVWLVAAVAFVLTLLATLYPAYKASKTQPAEALRYE